MDRDEDKSRNIKNTGQVNVWINDEGSVGFG